MTQTVKHLLIIILFTLATTLLIWLPHFLNLPNLFGLNFSNGFNTIYRNFDGLEYVIIAKTFYEPGLIAGIAQPLEPIYYAAHFPGYALLMLPFALILGYLKSMLLVSLFFTIASAIAFFFLVKDFKLTGNPLFLTILFLILPARWIIVRSVGSAEPVFIFFVLVSLYFFLKATVGQIKHLPIFISAVTASFAQLTRPPGALLGLALGLFVLWQAYKRKSFTYIFNFLPFLLVPLTLLGIFSWYGYVYNDFWAYFHSGDNIHLMFPPFQIFNSNQFWVGSIWLEDVIYIFALGFLGGLLLLKQKLYPLGFFVLTYLIASIFVAHRDISRYTLPATPFVLIAFEKILISREFKIVLIILALAFYLYSQNFLINNTAPIPDINYYN